ncbi:MAG TPA: hypothetical protein VK506_07530, partial [Conexibacter sp.]|nr:hypothetical protein [Conexibacter sp.]
MARIAPWVAVTSTVGGLACALALDTLTTGYGDGILAGVGWVVITLASSGVGLLLAVRCRGNPIGWLLLANGLVLAAVALADTYAAYTVLENPGALPGGDWAVLYAERTWPLLFVCTTAIAFVFPDGRLPSPRWRPVALVAAASFALVLVASLFGHEPYREAFENVTRPLPQLPESVVGALQALGGLGALGGLIAGALAVRTRLRRSSGDERRQLEWLAYAAALIPATVVVCLTEIAITGEDGAATGIALFVTMTAIPLAIGIAVTRYRLYEIDRLVNRTLVYALLTAGLAATYAAVSLSLGVGIGSGATLPTAAATLAVALLFGPLRSRAQLLVDRRFDRARYAGLRTVERFLEQLWAGHAAPEATGAMLAEALGDPGLELRFRLPESDVDVDAAGRVVDGSVDDERTSTPVRRGSLPLAT